MMGSLVIHPLHLGTIGRDKSIFTYLKNTGTQIEAPLLAWYIGGGKHHILVDTGGHDPEATELHGPYRREPDQDPLSQLAALGVRAEDIDVVILTHLHWDHATNAHLFPRARIYVQRRELQYAVAPLAPHRWAYEAYPPVPLHSDRYKVLDGDAEIADGVQVYLTPGHTPGLQGVAVHAADTVYFLAGDNVPLAEGWEARQGYGTMPCPDAIHAVHMDLEVYLASLRRIERLGDVIIPSHDWKALERREYR
jgi:glyoxylase-like metal-dependent hydrolase (beta-lactamase superfamily II)